MLGGAAALAYQALDQAEARGAEVARAARLSASAASAALRVLAGHGLAERTRRGWRRGGADLDEVAESTGAAGLHQRAAHQRYQGGPPGLAGPAPAVPGRPSRCRWDRVMAGSAWTTRTSGPRCY